MTFRQTLKELQNHAVVGGLPGNIAPQLKQLLEQSTPEEKKRIIEELKLRRMRQQQQQLQAQMAATTGDQSLGMKQGDLLSGSYTINVKVNTSLSIILKVRIIIKNSKENK